MPRVLRDSRTENTAVGSETNAGQPQAQPRPGRHFSDSSAPRRKVAGESQRLPSGKPHFPGGSAAARSRSTARPRAGLCEKLTPLGDSTGIDSLGSVQRIIVVSGEFHFLKPTAASTCAVKIMRAQIGNLCFPEDYEAVKRLLGHFCACTDGFLPEQGQTCWCGTRSGLYQPKICHSKLLPLCSACTALEYLTSTCPGLYSPNNLYPSCHTIS